MTRPFYINVSQDYGKLLVTWFDGKQRRRERVDYTPTLFVKPGQNQKTEGTQVWKTILGEEVAPIVVGNMTETREFLKRHANVDGFPIYGLNRYQYEYISDHFPGDIASDWDIDHINIAYLDIEVKSDDGFPEPERAEREVTAITIKDNKGIRVYGCGEYNKPIVGGKYFHCKDEYELLQTFLTHWQLNCPDIVSGWNVKRFDMVYLINRTTRVLGNARAKDYSPWKKIKEVRKMMLGRLELWYEISGVATLDYMELYRKYGPPGQRESYSLNYIAHYELKEKKLSYSEYGSLHNLYVQNYEMFIDYNIRDTLLVEQIEKKRGLIKLALILAYDSKVNYEDVFYQTRMWDSLIYNHLRNEHVVPPMSEQETKDDAYEGAYVKEPIPGRYKWVVSFDYTSLYPSLMMQFNISPDAIVEPKDYPDDIRDFLSKQNVGPEFLLGEPNLPAFRNHAMVLAANGHIFRTDKEGFLPTILRKMFADRQKYKKLYIAAKKEVETLKKEGKDASDAERRVSMYDLLQLCKKVCLNSCYGATGTPYFRYYDIRQAVAVTASGQFAIKYMEKHLNVYFNKVCGTKGVDYVIAVDTDSVYLNLENLVTQLFSDRKVSDNEIAEYLNRACESAIQPYIQKLNVKLANYVGATTVDLDMKRESICNQAIWTAKKRYILSVKDQEGVVYEKPEIKMSGIEAVKSSTPEVCRTKIKEAISIIINGTEPEIHKFILKFKEEFYRLSPEDIAFPRGISGLEAYHSERAGVIGLSGVARTGAEWKSKAPIHVKGALIYNELIHRHKLDKLYPVIREGEKIKFSYVKEPNPEGIQVISFPNVLPKELLDIVPYIDYNTQFVKAFLDPLDSILKTVGWKTEPTSSLAGFFK